MTEVTSWGRSGWAVGPGAGRQVDLPGPHRLEILLRGAEVDDAMGAFVFSHAPITVNPPHAHLGYMKIIYVLEGTYEVRVGDAEFTAGPGSLVVVPKASQHTFTTRTGGRMLFACAPSGNEELFLEQEKLGRNPTEEQLADLRARMGTVELNSHRMSTDGGER